MFKRMLIFVMCMLLIMSMMAGCQKGVAQEDAGNVDSGSNTEKENSSGEGSGDEEPVKLVYFTSVNVDTEGYDVNDNPYINYIREKTGINIEIMSEGTGYQEKLNTIMA